MYLHLLFILLVLTYWVSWRWRHRRLLKLAALVPGPPTLPVLGNALVFMTKPNEQLKIISNMFYTYGRYMRFWLGPELNVGVMDPDDIRHLLTSGKVNQKGPLYKYMEMFVGPGILTGETLMGLTKEDSENVKYLREIILGTQSMYDFVYTNMTHWWFRIPPIYWLAGRKKRQDHIIRMVQGVSNDIIAKRRQTKKDGIEESMCVVDRFIDGGLSEQELREETFTLFTASQEASAKITATVLLILAYLPEWQEKVYNEIVEFIGANDEQVTEENIKMLQHLELVFKEANRLMPIGAFIQRTVEEEISINEGKYTLPIGTSVIIPVMALHRDPTYWDDPDKVMPERFLPENIGKRNPNAYIPFSIGPMDCLGRVYATSMIKTLVVHILRRVVVSAEGRFEDLELNVAISAKMADGYNLSVRPRKAKTWGSR